MRIDLPCSGRRARSGASRPCFWLAAALFSLAASAAGCASHDQRIRLFREHYGAGRIAEAEAEIDNLLRSESGVPVEEIRATRGLSEEIDPDKGDTSLYLLEKAMVRLARGDGDAAVRILRACRDAIDERRKLSAGDFVSLVGDDTMRPFRAADYEQIMVRVMLAISDLVLEGKDSFPYALQIGEKQEEILGEPYAPDLGDVGQARPDYNPRQHYRRLAIGAYLEGIIQEAAYATTTASKAYARAREWSADSPLAAAAAERAANGRFAPEGHGVIHVFYLAGRGPALVQSTSPVTDAALAIAQWWAIIAGHGEAVITQSAVPVPGVLAADTAIAPLYIREPDGSDATTELLLDTNAVAIEQLDANMPWIIARAAVRRAVKAVAAEAVRKQVAKERGRDTGFLAGLITSAALTWWEDADTRNWTALPAQIQAARITRPIGDQEIDLGQGMRARVRVRQGRESYLVVLRPNLAAPGILIVDEYSRIEDPSPESPPEAPASEPVEEPAPPAAAAH
ncbi:MAG: hypothetical protein L0Z55_07610 [Planctomycetes bacterium]|nr:hypothetical protein [Planctomycetota bacterium]